MPVSRREFLHSAAALGFFAKEPQKFSIRTLTRGPKHHFFGYYGISPWNRSGKYLLCLESDFQDHLPGPDEPASVGIVDADTGEFAKVSETRAWNFQQGAMLHWNPLEPETQILYNDRRDDQVVSVMLDVKSGARRYLPRAISGVHNGPYALSLTYGRLTRMRPVVGYVGVEDPNPLSPHPDNDGVWLMDLSKGRLRLVVRIGDVYRLLLKKHPELEDQHMWLNHTVFNKDDSRFLFLARIWKEQPVRQLESAMFTAGLDGSNLREVVPFGKGVSHFDWRNSREIIATFRFDSDTKQHVLFTDGREDYRRIGEGFLSGDGHCSFAPGGNWMVTDRNNAGKIEKQLMIYHVKRKEGVLLGSFPMKEKKFLSGDLRCDLHPRWNRRGDAICFDALETESWTRQLHVATLQF